MDESKTPPGFILDLAHLALTRNYLKFEESFFLQTQGTSMGSTFAQSLACLYVDNFERLVVLNDDNPYRYKIKLWKRYIDDVLLIWTGNKEEALAFAVWLNGANPFLTFTMNIGENKLPFLDLLIYEHDGGLATEVYYKLTDCNNLLQYQSFHPQALRDNLPVGQFLQLRQNCSSVTDYRKHADKLTTKLHTKDYPPHLVSRARKRARNNNRDQLLHSRASKPDIEKIRLARDPITDIQEEITFLVTKGTENNWLTEHEAAFLIQTNPKILYFYILPKVHKEKMPPPGRPIVSGIGSVLEPLSKFVDFFLQPLVKRIPTYLKDTTHVLLLLESISFDKTKELLITLDVESLYTNIPQEATLEVISNLLEENMDESITPPGFLLDLPHLALTRNYFKFEESFFLQTQGTSMGSTFAPSLACLYVVNFERLVVLNDDNPYRDKIKLWKRYIDDVLLIWTGNREEALAFAVWLNGANPFLTFTMNIGENKLLFLDLLIYEHDGGLATEVYYKPTDVTTFYSFRASSHKP
ncbi:hypothetical protein NDU88_005552 [Pleurodeles waltl]|uniref:Reverse transcriptase domain-containing protein n=1 Tax=Pleurodeles waltl TaxID=8319 RepID=A0AAV7SM38_PLEWA|nr:hypothetical protein NDU88_005552 [Pleurodeles waltl]